MKITSIIKSLGAAAVLLCVFAATSCVNDPTPEPQRLFRPVNIQLTSVENSVIATWPKIGGALNYQVELYSDEATGTDENGDDILNYHLVAHNYNLADNTWTARDLDYATTYYFRIKANSGDPQYDSRWTELQDIRTKDEIVVVRAEVTDADSGTVLFTWSGGNNLTELVLRGADDFEKVYRINDADGQLTDTGVKPGQYTVTAYNSERAFNTFPFLVPILLNVVPAENTATGVTLRWANVSGLDRVDISEAGSTDAAYTFAIEGGVLRKDIPLGAEGLKPETAYSATIWLGDGSMGNTIAFTTMKQLPAGAVVVSTADELKAAVAAATSGTVIALNPGTYMILNSENAPANIVVTTDMTFISTSAQKAHINAKLFQINAPIESLTISGIEFSGFNPDADGNPGDTPTANNYFVDINGNNIAQNIVLENNYVHHINAAGILRANRGGTDAGVKNVTMRGNLFYNVNGANGNIINANGKTAIPGSVWTIENNTFTGLGVYIWNATTNAPAGSQQLLRLPTGGTDCRFTITNNTFFDIFTAGNCIDTGSATVDCGAVIIEKNIFAAKVYDATDVLRAPRVGNNGGVSIKDNVVWPGWTSYNNSNFGSSGPDPGAINVDPGYPEAYLRGNVPADADFTPSDAVKAYGWGDPRWIK